MSGTGKPEGYKHPGMSLLYHLEAGRSYRYGDIKLVPNKPRVKSLFDSCIRLIVSNINCPNHAYKLPLPMEFKVIIEREKDWYKKIAKQFTD